MIREVEYCYGKSLQNHMVAEGEKYCPKKISMVKNNTYII